MSAEEFKQLTTLNENQHKYFVNEVFIQVHQMGVPADQARESALRQIKLRRIS